MLEAPGDDVAAANEAAQRIACYYKNDNITAYPNLLQLWGHGVEGFVNEAASFVFALASKVTFPGPEHERLSRVLEAIRDIGPEGFGVEVSDAHSM